MPSRHTLCLLGFASETPQFFYTEREIFIYILCVWKVEKSRWYLGWSNLICTSLSMVPVRLDKCTWYIIQSRVYWKDLQVCGFLLLLLCISRPGKKCSFLSIPSKARPDFHPAGQDTVLMFFFIERRLSFLQKYTS